LYGSGAGWAVPKRPLARGDLIKVTWLDATEDSVGNPDLLKCIERVSYGLFWAQEQRGGHEVLVTTTTIDPDGPHQSGGCAYPIGMILKTEVVKRAK
jgi:hypothetical protein